MPYAFDPELVELAEMAPVSDMGDLAAARLGLAALVEPLNAQIDTSGVTITDHEIPGPADAPTVAVRVHAPDDRTSGDVPALLDIHGGGFVSGTMAMEHGFAVTTARKLGVVVVTVEYRLAPEHRFPAGLEDCYAALSWLHEQAPPLGVDRGRIGVGGQSAGGGLAAATALLARDRGGPHLCFQFLGIPELDHRLETTSMRTFVDTPMWHRANAILSWEHYLGPEPGEVSPYASPAVAEDLSNLPSVYVTTMEFDPLRDEGIVYAMRMMEAGVSVELHSFPGTFHGSAVLPIAAVSKRASAELMVALRRGLQVDAPPATGG